MSIQDVKIKPIPIVLDKERTLLFNLNALALLEEEYGTIEKAFEELDSGSIKAIRTIIWAGLAHEEMDEHGNVKITPFQVGNWIDLPRMKEIANVIQQAFAAAMPKDDGSVGTNPQQ